MPNSRPLLYRIGQLCRISGLSRSTLLYYERLGLLPSLRSASGYRLYTSEHVQRVQHIQHYRDMGLSVAAIAELLNSVADSQPSLLQQRLTELGTEIAQRRAQQWLLLRLLQTPEQQTPSLDKARWVNLFRQAGISEAQMQRWHSVFETQAPAAHADFLHSLAIPPFEIEAIRRWARGAASESSLKLAKLQIRPETAADYTAIEQINQLAFAHHPHSQQRETWLVNALRAANALSLSLVADCAGQLVGHIAVSPVQLSSDPTAVWYGLGPLAVLPAWQAQGVGSALVRASLAMLAAQQAQACVVLSDPAYFQRFGFRTYSELRCNFAVPAEYFLCYAFSSNPSIVGVAHYHPLFAQV